MSIFIEKDDIIDVCVKYVENEKKEIEIVDEDHKEAKELNVKFLMPDYRSTQKIIQNCMRQNSDGGFSVDLFAMQESLLTTLAKEWDVKDKDGKPVPLNAKTIGSLRVEIARALVNMLSDKIGPIF